VQEVGAGSWRLKVTDSDVAERALFVRDALGLTVAPTDDLPPALAGPVPDSRGALSDRDRPAASEQWGQWWRKILDIEFGVNRSLEPSPSGRAALEVLGELRTVSDPPEFSALAQTPQLRSAVRATFGDALRWQRNRHPLRPDAALEWSVIKRAVDDVAFDRDVRVDALRGAIVVLPLAVPWWRRVGPGQVLCSELSAHDPQTNYRIAYEAFASSLD
jgi:hypothetical protein